MVWNKVRERLRAKAVERLTAVGAAAEPGLERYTEQAAQAFAAPIALLSLIRDDRLLVKASTGTDMTCISRKHSFCTHVLDRDDLLEVGDTLEHPVLRTLPFVIREPFIRYYIGAPLTLTSGVDVGALCVLGPVPRPPASADQRAYLQGLARQATALLERQLHLNGALAA